MTVKEWVAFWQKNYDVPGVRHTTYEAHRYVLENHILPWIGDCPLESLTTQKIERFLEEHQLDGNKRNGKPLSQQTMRHIQNLLSKVLRQAATHGLIERNPVQGICCSAPKKVKATILADNEVRDYLSAAEELGYLPIFLLALEYGLRQRELIALMWGDLDIENCTLTIHEGRAVAYRNLIEYEGRVRKLLLSQYAVEQLVREHRKHPSSQILFIHPGTLRPYSPQMIRRLHRLVLEHAELGYVRFEDLRHTYAVRALRRGEDVKTLAHLLGYGKTVDFRKQYHSWIYSYREEEANPQEELCEAAEKIGTWFESITNV